MFAPIIIKDLIGTLKIEMRSIHRLLFALFYLLLASFYLLSNCYNTFTPFSRGSNKKPSLSFLSIDNIHSTKSTRTRTVLNAIAPYKKPRNQNIPGNLFVDQSCIDCDICRWMCPSTFARKGLGAAVISQPISEKQKIQAYAAMITCPVGAIRLISPDLLVKNAMNVFPAAIDPVRLPNVYHLGYSSSESFGATSYFIKRAQIQSKSQPHNQQLNSNSNNIIIENNDDEEEDEDENEDEPGVYGNIMIDCPRYNSRLAKAIEDEGGIATMIITHKDDLHDHEYVLCLP